MLSTLTTALFGVFFLTTVSGFYFEFGTYWDSDKSSESEPPTCPPPNGTLITLPNPEDCSQYYVCADAGPPRLQNCQPGTWFNPLVGVCDWPFNVPEGVCKPPGQNSTTPRPTTTEWPNNMTTTEWPNNMTTPEWPDNMTSTEWPVNMTTPEWPDNVTTTEWPDNITTTEWPGNITITEWPENFTTTELPENGTRWPTTVNVSLWDDY